MEDFLRYLVSNLVGNPVGMELTCHELRGTLAFRLMLPYGEIGKIVGKQGRTTEAIRNLLSAAAARQGKKASLQIFEI
jgi:predicted RNA-binding protein YlqC (UPF0109 family)